MPSDGPFTPKRRDAVLALIALVLLAGPLWTPMLHLGQPTYTYKRARIVVGGDDGLSYANKTGTLVTTPISVEIGCSIPEDARTCAFERYLANNHTIPLGASTNNPNLTEQYPGYNRYQYVLVNGSAYRSVATPNRSAAYGRSWYPLDLALKPVPLDDAIKYVSLNGASDSLPSPVREAATQGVAHSHEQVDVPQTPIRVANGTYYRVYDAGKTDPTALNSAAHVLLAYVAPAVGFFSLFILTGRIEVTYVGPRR